MKKIFILLFIFAVVLTGCKKDTGELVVDRPVGLVELAYDDLMEKLESNTDFIVYIGRPDCGDCQQFNPRLDTYLNKNKDVGLYYINIQSYRDASRSEGATADQISFYENIQKKLNFSWVPTIHRIVNGEFTSTYEFARIEDTSQDFEAFTEWFTKELSK